MKLLFIADVHLKVGAKDVPNEWSKMRFAKLNSEIRKAIEEHKPDICVVGGDVFDKMPNIDEIELYYEFVQAFTVATYIIPGNHEATTKTKTFLSKLINSTRSINPNVNIIDISMSIHGIDFLPYNELKAFDKGECAEDWEYKVLVTHVRGEIPPHVTPEIDLNKFDKWKTVLAGDLHSYENSQRNILYPGSPVTTSFHRQDTPTGYIIFDTKTHEHIWHRLDVPQLIRKTVKAGDPMPATDYDHTVYEVEGDITELGALADNDLISKKVVKRHVDTALILDASMTPEEELKEFMLYILQLDENKVNKLLKVYSDYAHLITE